MTYDVILANPLYDEFRQGDIRGFQLGLVYLATYLESNNFSSTILTGEGVTTKIMNEIDRGNGPIPLVGLYVSADNTQEIERVCISLKNTYNSIKIILGGPEAAIRPSYFLRSKVADFVCTGDGEECIVKLIDYIKNNVGIIDEIPFLSYLDKNGEVKNSLNSKVNLNLDKYPIPDRSKYEDFYMNTSHIATSRGCASECTFCYEGLDKKIRRHSVGRIIDEMKYLNKSYGTKYFTFVDDTFTTDRRKVHKLCERIHKELKPYENVTWYCEAKVSDIVKEPTIVDKMVDAGLIRMQFGTESASQKVIDSYKKEITIDQIYKSVDICSKTNLSSMFTNVIIGGAYETEATLTKTINMCLELMEMNPGVLECSSTFLSPYSGTDILNRPEAYKIDIVDKEFVTGSSDSYIFSKSSSFTKEKLLILGKYFASEVRAKMISLIPKIPKGKLRRQLMYSKYSLSTSWNELLMTDFVFASWSNMVNRGYRECISIDDDLRLILPFRTFSIENLENNVFIWEYRNIVIEFSPFEIFLIEHASGKITMSEIVDRAYNFYHQRKVSRERLRSDIVSFYNQLASEFLLLYREFK